MAKVANRFVGAEFQNYLQGHLQKRFREGVLMYFKAFNQAGYLPGTFPPKGTDEQLAAGMANMRAIIAQGGPQTERQQRFARDMLEAARSRSDGNSNTS
jgi:hypothetical protein